RGCARLPTDAGDSAPLAGHCRRMVVVTQLIYLHVGGEQAFLDFEAAVLPLLARHGGELLLRLRPDPASFVAGSLGLPYEVHVVRFASADGLAGYTADDDRRRVVHLKDAAVREAFVATAMT